MHSQMAMLAATMDDLISHDTSPSFLTGEDLEAADLAPLNQTISKSSSNRLTTKWAV